jgi:ketosteroid isomerase-like protein
LAQLQVFRIGKAGRLRGERYETFVNWFFHVRELRIRLVSL